MREVRGPVVTSNDHKKKIRKNGKFCLRWGTKLDILQPVSIIKRIYGGRERKMRRESERGVDFKPPKTKVGQWLT